MTFTTIFSKYIDYSQTFFTCVGGGATIGFVLGLFDKSGGGGYFVNMNPIGYACCGALIGAGVGLVATSSQVAYDTYNYYFSTEDSSTPLVSDQINHVDFA